MDGENVLPRWLRILFVFLIVALLAALIVIIFGDVIMRHATTRNLSPDFQDFLSDEELLRKQLKNWHPPSREYSDSTTDWDVTEEYNSMPPLLVSRQSNILDMTRFYTDRTLNLSTETPYEIQQLNKRAFEIADTYMKEATGLKEFCRDPLILLAMSRVETGAYADMNKLYSAAMPTVGVTNLSADLLDVYGATETLANDKYWDRMLPYSARHQGPLQMGINYGVDVAIVPSDLKGREDNQLLASRYARKYSVPRDWYVSIRDNTGDRYNWADACNRTAGVLNYWSDYYNNFDNVYEYVALAGMAHNVGGAVFTLSDRYVINQSYFPWKNVGAAREYAKQLVSPKVINYISETAKQDIQDWRAGKKSIPDAGRSIAWRYKVVAESDVDTSLFTLKGDYMNRLGYPVGCIYYYELLYQLYYQGR